MKISTVILTLACTTLLVGCSSQTAPHSAEPPSQSRTSPSVVVVEEFQKFDEMPRKTEFVQPPVVSDNPGTVAKMVHAQWLTPSASSSPSSLQWPQLTTPLIIHSKWKPTTITLLATTSIDAQGMPNMASKHDAVCAVEGQKIQAPGPSICQVAKKDTSWIVRVDSGIAQKFPYMVLTGSWAIFDSGETVIDTNANYIFQVGR